MTRHIPRSIGTRLAELATSSDRERLRVVHAIERTLERAGCCWMDLARAILNRYAEAPYGRQMPDERAVVLYLHGHPDVAADDRDFLGALKRKIATGTKVTEAEWLRLRTVWMWFEGVTT